MEDRLARLISILFHPLLMPLYILLFLLNLDSYVVSLLPLSSKFILSGVMILITILLPMTFIWILYRRKLISSFFMETKEERIYPLLVTCVFYYLAYYLLKGTHIPGIFSVYMLGSTILAVCALIITFYRKISLHMLGMGGLTGLALGSSDHFRGMPWLLFIFILLTGLVGSARLKISAHKSSEIYSGFLLGAGIMFILFLLA